MNFFGLSPGELLLILMLAMIVLGPEKLPEVAGSIGKWIAEFRRATQELIDRSASSSPPPQQPSSSWVPSRRVKTAEQPRLSYHQ